MTLTAITGASGRIGRRVEAVARAAGMTVQPLSLPTHDLLHSGEWQGVVASADVLIHLAGIVENGADVASAQASLNMLVNVLGWFQGRRLIIASSLAVEPERFGLPYRFNYYGARCLASEAFSRAWGECRPTRRVDVLRFGQFGARSSDIGHAATWLSADMLDATVGAVLCAELPGFHVRYVVGSAGPFMGHLRPPHGPQGDDI